MWLVGKAARGRHGGGGLAPGKQAAGPGDAQVGLERVRRQTGLGVEPPHELEAAEAADRGELSQRHGAVEALAQVRAGTAHRGVLGAPARPRGLARPQVRTQAADRGHHRLLELEPGRAGGEGGVRAQEPRAQRRVLEDDPARGARGHGVVLGIRTEQARVEVEHLVGPALGDRGRAGVHRLGLEHEQLAAAGALVGGVELELGRAALDDRDGPRRVGMRPVGVRDEARVERLDAGQRGRAKVARALGHATTWSSIAWRSSSVANR